MARLAAASKIRVAVYGGAFDPPTVDHMRCCAQILRSRQVDEVWLTPCGPRPDKPGIKTSTTHRWAMCEIAVDLPARRRSSLGPLAAPPRPPAGYSVERSRAGSDGFADDSASSAATRPRNIHAAPPAAGPRPAPDGAQVNTCFSPTLPVRVCDADVTRSRAYFTYDLLRKLSSDHADTHDFKFVVGTDWLQAGTDIRKWESDDGGVRRVTGHKLVAEFDFLVLKRPGHPAHGELSDYGPRFSYERPSGNLLL